MLGVNELFFMKLSLFLLLASIISCSQEKYEEKSLDTFVIIKEATYRSESLIPESINLNKNPDWILTDNAGWVVEKLVDNGDFIKAGQTILRLDPRDLRLSDSAARYQYEAAKASLKAQVADFIRFSELKNKKFISDAEWEKRKAQLAVYEAEFEELADSLGVVSVRSFANGKIKNLYVNEGELLKAGEKVAQIILDKKIISKTKNHKFSIKTAKKLRAIKIPISALVDGQIVFKIINNSGNKLERSGTGVVREVKVSTGKIDESSVLVTDGLKEGDLYVVSGAHLLIGGQKVRFAY